jgi:NADH-quinone oxidoreductase subunit N
MTELTYLLPVGVVLAAALVVVLLDLVLPRQERYLLPWIAFGGCVLALFSVYQTHLVLVEQRMWFLSYAARLAGNSADPVILQGAFALDGFGIAIWAVACLAGALAVLIAASHPEESVLASGEFYGLMLLAVAGMMLLGVAHDWATLVVSLEIMSVATYILAGSKREDLRSNEAALKYLILGGFGTAFLLLGVVFYYGANGSLSLTPNAALLRLPEDERLAREMLSSLGMGLALAGALFKIGATPFHFWIPDVYEGAPTAVTALMASGVKAAGFAVLARVFFETFGDAAFRAQWVALLLPAAVLTMVAGNILAMRQNNLKRMLAYSSIAHTGYLLLAFLVLPRRGDGAVMGEHLQAVLFYLVLYSVMTLGAFAVVSLQREDGRALETMDDFAGLAKEQPGIALCMALFMVSLAGLPPTGGFFAKFLIFRDAIAQGVIERGNTGIIIAAVIGILTSVASLYYYLRVVVMMYMTPAGTEEAAAPARCRYAWGACMLIYVAALVILLTGIVPGWFYWQL